MVTSLLVADISPLSWRFVIHTNVDLFVYLPPRRTEVLSRHFLLRLISLTRTSRKQTTSLILAQLDTNALALPIIVVSSRTIWERVDGMLFELYLEICDLTRFPGN